MNELNIDAESIARNKQYDVFDHLQHLLKIGWLPNSQVIKKFLSQNNLTNEDIANAISRLNEANTKECCTDREKM